jgi:hypothetical protein
MKKSIIWKVYLCLHLSLFLYFWIISNLYDKKLGIYTDIQKEDYVFDGQQGEDSSRFEIVYQPKSNLTTHNVNSEQVKIYEKSR